MHAHTPPGCPAYRTPISFPPSFFSCPPQVGSLWASQVLGLGFNSALEAAQEALQQTPPSPSTPPTPPSLQPPEGSQGKKASVAAAAAAAAAAGAAAVEVGEEDDWWRAGDKSGVAGVSGGSAAVGGVGHQALMALEVVKPLMDQDLERLSDQVRVCPEALLTGFKCRGCCCRHPYPLEVITVVLKTLVYQGVRRTRTFGELGDIV